MIEGTVAHEDSMGNKGTIASGDVQWMTADSGIIHQEMPQRYERRITGFQLWVNLPASHKMMPSRYRRLTREQIPTITVGDGTQVTIVCGEVNGVKGPVQDIVVEATHLRLILEPRAAFVHQVPRGHTAFAYLFEGSGYFDPAKEQRVGSEHLVIFDDGDSISTAAADQTMQCLLVSGQPIKEPVAWRGPIVMNTEEKFAESL